MLNLNDDVSEYAIGNVVSEVVFFEWFSMVYVTFKKVSLFAVNVAFKCCLISLKLSKEYLHLQVFIFFWRFINYTCFYYRCLRNHSYTLHYLINNQTWFRSLLLTEESKIVLLPDPGLLAIHNTQAAFATWFIVHIG